jgi:hypothetical protein
MSIESTILVENISQTDSSVNPDFVYSEKNKAAGYHKQSDNLHTAVYTISNFTGLIKLQGSLALYPGESDWVDIKDSDINFANAVAQSYTFNFNGNFLWLRAGYKCLEGDIVKIRYNY